MNEVKKCSLSGIAFTMDTDAYETLNTYIESLHRTYQDSPEGAEIIADIEARIAELILSAQDGTRVVERPLIDNIIRQLGSAEDIMGDEGHDRDLQPAEPRIPRRLYRDMEGAKLGGVCAGLGKYFNTDPTWIRLALFVPIAFWWFGWFPVIHWMSPVMGNMFGVELVCYVIMWFAVPAARTARQRLEMNGERITEQSIRDLTATSLQNDPDSIARPVVAEVVSLFGRIVLILLKIIAGVIVLGLILAACALLIGLFALIIGGQELIEGTSIWLVSLGVLTTFIFLCIFIYMLMSLIASRSPNGKVMLVLFLLWFASLLALIGVGVREHVGPRIAQKPLIRLAGDSLQIGVYNHKRLIVEGDTLTYAEWLKQLRALDADQVEAYAESADVQALDEKGNPRVALHVNRTDREGREQVLLEVDGTPLLTVVHDENSAAIRIGSSALNISGFIKVEETDDE